ncbi:hypothetical protein BDZ45DRAFT_705823 [Acephala macrosclerotiorum]|nr:hypothetical protein BDZ45DRAFT_705823 [Acephala macrosclerotiorum]
MPSALEDRQTADYHRVDPWTAMPQLVEQSNLPPSPFKGGSPGVLIPKGKTVYTDPVDFAVKEQSMLNLSIYSEKGQNGGSITGHPGSRTSSCMVSRGKVNSSSVAGASVKHWYFATSVEAWALKNARAWIILGDSITDGRGSTDDANNRRMQKGGVTNVGMNNQAAGGNTQSGVKYVMIFEGVNDIGGGGTSGTQTQIGNNLISAFKTIAADCKKAGIAVFAATITPFGRSGQAYSNPTREATRVKVDAWVMTSGTFDAVVDFSKIIGDAATPSQLASQYNSGDHFHPNAAGYQAITDAIPIDIFT